MVKEYDSDTATFMGVPRKIIPWWPTIDYDKCNYCMECDKFCPHKVFKKQEEQDKKLIVENPNNCVVFCRACAKLCEPDALAFPDKKEITQLIKDHREKNPK
ncbi:MAG: ferredoxin family protein [Asgard group archaeon]|nr:ferredoxin family protein [Asgard group archaeon]